MWGKTGEPIRTVRYILHHGAAPRPLRPMTLCPGLRGADRRTEKPDASTRLCRSSSGRLAREFVSAKSYKRPLLQWFPASKPARGRKFTPGRSRTISKSRGWSFTRHLESPDFFEYVGKGYRPLRNAKSVAWCGARLRDERRFYRVGGVQAAYGFDVNAGSTGRSPGGVKFRMNVNPCFSFSSIVFCKSRVGKSTDWLAPFKGVK